MQNKDYAKVGDSIKKISIIIADDHAVLRSGLKALLNCSPQFEVIAEAGNGLEAVKLVGELHPDILILDLAMPIMNGVECIKEIRSRGMNCPILVLTMYDDEEFIKEVMQSGANGYLLKKSADTELMEAILRIHAGRKYLNETVSQALIDMLLRAPGSEGPADDPYKKLSGREREVLRYLAKGHTNTEIAEKLSLSSKTIDTYRARIMNKLNVNKKSELVRYAIRHKMIAT
ncbi:MAG: response regulator transcription factor [Pelosinus sp.]|nr:response regulator transcription factor [Pelosinus sp.]